MNEAEIRHLAKLARIRIADKEIPKIAGKLARVLEYISLIREADTAGADMPEAGELRNVMREDGVPHETGMYTEAILQNAPAREGEYIKVKKIL